MDPTTLVSFIFRVPPEVRTVELLGSWDNFHQPYRMHHDRRRGTGFWSGCFKFENIVFDGHGVQWSKPRSGGLKQGGMYWYYYKVNFDFDAFDDRQPTTTKCPLLPGQTVNILDVPCEVMSPPQRSQTAHGDIAGTLSHLSGQQQTMEPADKFAMLEPPPMSKLHSRCLSDEALDGRLEGRLRPPIVIEGTVSPPSTSQSRRLPPECVDSKMDDYSVMKIASRASSAYSQQSTQTLQVNVFDVTAQDGRGTASASKGDPPAFPYPNGLGPVPLGSLEALSSVLFAVTEDAQLPASEHSERLRLPETHKPSKKPSDISIGPKSVQNVQFYGSRPGTNLAQDPEQYRPRMYSLPSAEIGVRCTDDVPSVPGTSNSVDSCRKPHDGDKNLTPDHESNSFDDDLTSPTHSVATVSTPGQNTPSCTLSARNSANGPTQLPLNDTADAGLDSITDRLETLGSRSSAKEMNRRAHQPRRFDTREARLGSRSFVNYSLPTIASESSGSLAKTISIGSPRSPRRDDVPSPPILADGEGRSMAEDIFSELGF